MKTTVTLPGPVEQPRFDSLAGLPRGLYRDNANDLLLWVPGDGSPDALVYLGRGAGEPELVGVSRAFISWPLTPATGAKVTIEG